MAKLIIRVDVRSRSKLLAALEAEHEQRRAYGELGFSLCINDAKRNIGYVILDWKSFASLEQFIDSNDAREILKKWPVEEILEVLKLRDIAEERNEEPQGQV